MEIFTKEIESRLRKNAEEPDERATMAHQPVVKVFNPFGAATWLFTELDEDDRLFGLCDLGMGCPELGYVMRHEIENLRVFGQPLERDIHFTPNKTLVEYAEEARKNGRIAI